MFNAWNTRGSAALNSGATFSQAGQITNLPTALGALATVSASEH